MVWTKVELLTLIDTCVGQIAMHDVKYPYTTYKQKNLLGRNYEVLLGVTLG